MAADAMDGSMLLQTKFLPPVTGATYLRRERLHRRMAEASSTPVTLLSAPAGFGKTSLLAGWLREVDAPWAFLSIDAQDNDPVRLWSHLIAALRRLAGPIGEDSLVELLRSRIGGPVDPWLTPLINDLARSTATESFLVLDDLHLIVDPQQRAGIGQLASSLPAWLHLIISTRADPPLAVPRLRATGRIIEIREADLRFVSSEASSLLASSAANHLDSEQIETLLDRTEGWAAGLQLATIVLNEHDSESRFDEIVGSQRPFADYLITEVVDQQPDRMRAFLYATSVVDRINPSMARAISGDRDADVLLRTAEQQGLFLAALDGGDEWYRYHHLFAEALRHELKVIDPDASVNAHSAAARWFEAHGESTIALEQWLAAERPEEALRLAVEVGFSLVDRGQAVTIEGIARRIPPTATGSDPAKGLAYGLLHVVFEPETFFAWVADAASTVDLMEHPDEDLVTQCLTVQSMADISIGAWDKALERATSAVDRGSHSTATVDYSERAKLQVIRAAGWLERPVVAESHFRDYVDDPRTPDALRVMVAPAAWALAAALAGRIDDAAEWAERATEAVERGFHNVFSTQDLLLTEALVARERGGNDIAVAAIDALRTVEVKPNFSLQAVALIELALIQVDRGCLDDAHDTLNSALAVRSGGPLGPLVISRIDAARSAVHLAAGDLVKAHSAAIRMQPGLWREVALARCLLEGGDFRGANATLQDLEPATPRQFVSVEMLRALSIADPHTDSVRELTVAALTVAATVGLGMTLISTGSDAKELVDLAAFAVPPIWTERTRATFARSAAGASGPSTRGLVEQPTEREREIARYLPSRLTVPEMAREIGISTNTLKTHLKNLYRKLGVATREEAIAVGRDAGIIR